MKKKKGRYQKSDPGKNKDRKYTSYEDAPLREYKDEDPIPGNITKKFFKVFLILFLSVAAVLALLNLDKLTPDNISHWFQYDLLGKTEGNGYPVRFNGTVVEKENFSVMDGAAVYCSDTSVVVLNSNAGEYQNSQHAFANPVLKSTSGYSIIYNSDANGFMIISRDKMIHSASSQQKIYEADIAHNGVYAILNHGSDYLAELSVYKNDNTRKFEYSFADYYVNNVSINKDGTRAALSGTLANNGSIISVIYILDFSQGNYLQKYEFDNSFIYDIEYLDNGNVFAVGSDMAYFIDVENSQKKDIPYNLRTLSNYEISRSQGLILSLSTDSGGHECDIICFDTEGKRKAEFSTDSRVVSIDAFNDKIAVLTQNNLGIYDKNGNKQKDIQIDSDAKKACFADKNNLYILGTSRISKVTIEE